MDRQRRKIIKNPIDQIVLSEAIYQLGCFNAFERKEACLIGEGQARYDSHMQATREMREKNARLRQAIRDSEILRPSDLDIRVY